MSILFVRRPSAADIKAMPCGDPSHSVLEGDPAHEATVREQCKALRTIFSSRQGKLCKIEIYHHYPEATMEARDAKQKTAACGLATSEESKEDWEIIDEEELENERESKGRKVEALDDGIQ